MKWNMGWMHDTLAYLRRDPIHRRFHHDLLTFGPLYAFTENFVLPLSHDEVVHGKGSLLGKHAGRRMAALRQPAPALTYQATSPGKKLDFMGGEFGQWREWDAAASSTGDCCTTRPRRVRAACPRPQPALPRAPRAARARLRTARASRGSTATTPTSRCSRSGACARDGALSSGRRSTSRRCRATATGSAYPSPGTIASSSTATRRTTAARTSGTPAGSLQRIARTWASPARSR